MTTALDLFAGPGGWSQACRMLGVDEVGVEWDPQACATARAAGHIREQADVRLYVPDRRYDGLIASPPCQTFSAAGNGTGRRDLDRLLAAVVDVAAGIDPTVAVLGGGSGFLDDMFDTDPGELDERSVLVLEPLALIRDMRPTWVALEQVPAVLPIWQAYAAALRGMGYSVWCGNLHAEQYGVPQTRKRAVLMAHLHRQMRHPHPTHSRYHGDSVTFDRGVLPWVSMATALGWSGGDVVGFPRRIEDGDEAVTMDGVEYRARDLRTGEHPSLVVTEKARSWSRWVYRNGNQEHTAERDLDEPAPTVHFGHALNLVQWVFRGSGNAGDSADRPLDEPSATLTGKGTATWTPRVETGSFTARDHRGQRGEKYDRPIDEPAPTVTGGVGGWRVNDQSGTDRDEQWPTTRPATTVAGRDIIADPGANSNRFNGSTKSRNDGVRVTVAEAGVLQSFPADYPWQGTRTQQHQQVGDAVPPLLAHAILRELVG
jgi:DNA (cytosine-5)-methyltransferase 1